MVVADIDWRAKPGFTYEQVLEHWKKKPFLKMPWWERLFLTDEEKQQNTPEYWARIQYAQMLDELEEWRRRNWADWIGAWWLR